MSWESCGSPKTWTQKTSKNSAEERNIPRSRPAVYPWANNIGWPALANHGETGAATGVFSATTRLGGAGLILSGCCFLCAESLTSRYITYSDTKMWLDHHRSSKFLGDCHLWQTPVLSVQPSCSLVLWQEALHTSSATMCWTLGTDRSIENAWFVGNFRKK